MNEKLEEIKILEDQKKVYKRSNIEKTCIINDLRDKIRLGEGKVAECKKQLLQNEYGVRTKVTEYKTMKALLFVQSLKIIGLKALKKHFYTLRMNAVEINVLKLKGKVRRLKDDLAERQTIIVN